MVATGAAFSLGKEEESGSHQKAVGARLAARCRREVPAAFHRRGEFHRLTQGARGTYQGHRNGSTTAAWAYSSGWQTHLDARRIHYGVTANIGWGAQNA